VCCSKPGPFFSALTILENVALVIREQTTLRDERLINELSVLKLHMCGLSGEELHRFPLQLSGGMRKRAALARALALDPQFLPFDEPSAGLGPVEAARLDRLFLALHDSLDFTAIVITHDLDTLYAECDRIAALAERKIIESGSIDQLQRSQHPWVQRYFAGDRGDAPARAHRHALTS
jgi:phospholipid/cholesterol/gamma-HCH transport system ATP-binding protein